jgi:penicillin-binding protein 2
MKRRHLSIKDSREERFLFKKRILIIASVMGIFALLLMARLFYLQIVEHKIYTTMARQNLLNLSPSEPNRGLIYDRNGVLLAENIPVFNLVVTPNRVQDLQDTLAGLQKVINISDDDLQQFNRQLRLHRRFQPVLLRTRLTEQELDRFSVEQYHFPGVGVQVEMIRHYPLGAAFASVIGYVGRINEKELATLDPSNYSATNFVGKTGIEKQYESTLHGTVGYREEETDASGQVVRVMKNTPPIAGSNLYLTLDSRLQAAALQTLDKQQGAIVALDPRNGEVLAFVSAPSFDPNLFVAGISQKDYDTLQNADDHPLYNRALQGRFPPGSTVKPVLGIEGLISGVITPEFTISDPGWFRLRNSTHIYHDDVRTGHGIVNIAKAIPVSSDTFFFTLADKMGIQRIDDILQRFGYGERTGIDLPNEASGLVPSPAWKEKKLHTAWYPGDTVITGIGQGYLLVTPLQLAHIAATLAMRGQPWQPHVVLRTQSIGSAAQTTTPISLPKIQISDNVWQIILTGMRNVVADPIGTAYRYFRDVSYTLAGKTGTAQVFSLKKNQRDKDNLLPVNLRDNSLFIAFAPADNPQIAIAVMVQHSTTPAAQIAREVLDYYFKEQNK